jgi:hypothetical protein
MGEMRTPPRAGGALGGRLAAVAGQLGRTARLFLADHPRLYYPVMRHRKAYEDLLITDATELVIEGYPRSGNTFAVAALQYVQPRRLRLARHTHAPAQVFEAVRRSLPTLILVRDPRDAAISLVIREPGIPLETALRRYVRFYGRIHPHRNGYTVASFEQVTTAYGDVMRAFNARWGLALVPFEHTPANRDAVFAVMEEMERSHHGALTEARVARPSATRSEPKAQLEARLDEPRYRTLLDDCDEMCLRFLALAPGIPAGDPEPIR